MKGTTDVYGGNLLENTIVPYVTEVGRACIMRTRW
jgi:hypothetical protein